MVSRSWRNHTQRTPGAARVVKLLEAIEAIAAVAHHLAGLADITELFGELQQPNLRADDLLCSVVMVSSYAAPGDQDTAVSLSFS